MVARGQFQQKINTLLKGTSPKRTWLTRTLHTNNNTSGANIHYLGRRAASGGQRFGQDRPNSVDEPPNRRRCPGEAAVANTWYDRISGDKTSHLGGSRWKARGLRSRSARTKTELFKRSMLCASVRRSVLIKIASNSEKLYSR